MRAFRGVLRRCCQRNAGHSEHRNPLTSTCVSCSPSWRTLLTSAYVHAIGDSTRSSSLDLFDRHGSFACAILAARCWVSTSVYSSTQPILLTSRQLKKAHRDRAARLQTMEDPLLVRQTISDVRVSGWSASGHTYMLNMLLLPACHSDHS